MTNRNIERARRALERLGQQVADRDHDAFFGLLAGDVVFGYSAPEGTPVSEELHGKQAVVDFTTRTSPELVEDHELAGPLEYFERGDRVVALGAESYTIRRSGVRVEDHEFAIVIDFRDGLMARMLTIKDLTDFADAYREG